MDQPRRSADPTGWQPQPDHTAGLPAPPPTFTTRSTPVETGGAHWAAAAPVEAAEEDLDLLAEVNRRPSRTTALLIVGILAAVAFIGGVVVQKNYGGTSAGGAAGAAAGGFAGRAGGNAAGYGGFGGAGGFPGGEQAGGAAPGGAAAGGAAGGGTAGGGTAGGTTAAATPVVVGTVAKMSGSSLTVKNLGGKSVNVKIPEGATITLVAGKTLTTLKTGATVSVAGTTAADGTVTATSVTVRS